MFNLEYLYLLQQRTNIYASVMQELVTGLILQMRNTKDETTRSNLEKILYNIEPQIKKIQDNIKLSEQFKK